MKFIYLLSFGILFLLVCCDNLSRDNEVGNIPIEALDNFRQGMLDTIAELVAAQNWYAAQRHIADFEYAFPEMKNSATLRALSQQVRASVNGHYSTNDYSGKIKTRYKTAVGNLDFDIDKIKQRTFFHAPDATRFINENSVQAYLVMPFDTTAAPRLQFTVQHVSNQAHELQYIQIEADSLIYSYLPEDSYCGNDGALHWVWFDDNISNNEIASVLQKITRAEKVKIVLYFKENYRKEQLVSPQELAALSTILTSYETIQEAR